MVAAEAASAGVPPLVADHSGLAEVAAGIAAEYPAGAAAADVVPERRRRRAPRAAARRCSRCRPTSGAALGLAARRAVERNLELAARRRAAARALRGFMVGGAVGCVWGWLRPSVRRPPQQAACTLWLPIGIAAVALTQVNDLPRSCRTFRAQPASRLRRGRRAEGRLRGAARDLEGGASRRRPDFTVAVEEEFALLDPATPRPRQPLRGACSRRRRAPTSSRISSAS